MGIVQDILSRFATSASAGGSPPSKDQSKMTVPSTGEVAWADPSRLFANAEIAQYNPSVLVTRKGYQVFDQMRNDDQVKASLGFKKHAVLSTGWAVESPEDSPENYEPAEFLKWVFENMDGTLYEGLFSTLTALDYGFSVTEKVFEEAETPWGKRIVLKKLKTCRPHHLELIADEHGNLKKLLQYQGNIGYGGNLSGAGKELPLGKFIIFAHDFEFGNWYGKSDLEAAYRPWWAKDNAYKWLSMLLERRGIPPVFLLYDGSFNPSQISDLKKIVDNLQGCTSGLLPRPTKDSLDFWTPELSSQAKEVFMESLAMYNQDISRALLMPGLIGMTPDASTGSFARAKVHFDAFIMVLNFLRQRVEDNIMAEQVIKPLLDYNYPNLEWYPTWKFLPITEDVKTDLLSQWIEASKIQIVQNTPDDEAHIRQILEFPEKTAQELEKVTIEEESDEKDMVEYPEEEEFHLSGQHNQKVHGKLGAPQGGWNTSDKVKQLGNLVKEMNYGFYGLARGDDKGAILTKLAHLKFAYGDAIFVADTSEQGLERYVREIDGFEGRYVVLVGWNEDDQKKALAWWDAEDKYHLAGQHNQKAHGKGGARADWIGGDDIKVAAKERGLYIPPAWSDVHINPDAKGDLQAIGFDKTGRLQPLYSKEFMEKSKQAKFKRIEAFAKDHPKIVSQIKKDLSNSEEARALFLIEKTGFRPGSDADTGAKVKAYGATNMLIDHVKVSGDTASFSFTGKKGVSINQTIKDPELASVLKKQIDSKPKGSRLFNTNEDKVRDYLKDIPAGKRYKVKDFRTHKGTSEALREVNKLPKSLTKKDAEKAVKEVSKRVAGVLGNTPTVAKQSYINPMVWDLVHARTMG